MKKGKQGSVLSYGKGINLPFISSSFPLIISPLYSKDIHISRDYSKNQGTIYYFNLANYFLFSCRKKMKWENYHSLVERRKKTKWSNCCSFTRKQCTGNKPRMEHIVMDKDRKDHKISTKDKDLSEYGRLSGSLRIS